MDYLTASQGGMCAIVGTACCNYIGNDTKAEDAIISHVERVQQLKLGFQEEHTETTWIEGSWESWLSWLNPLNWFSGLGGWLSAIIHGIFVYSWIYCTHNLYNQMCTNNVQMFVLKKKKSQMLVLILVLLSPQGHT